MKKLLLFSSLLFTCLSSITHSQAEIGSYLPSEQAKQPVILKDLNFKTVMMAFYQKKLTHIVIPELDNNKEKYVGYKDRSNSQTKVLIYSEPVAYFNSSQQQRFLLTVSHIAIDDQAREIAYCFACSSFNDVYIFKKNSNNQFELVSQAVGEDAWVGLGTTDDTYSPQRILSELVNVGSNVQGVIREIETSHQGYTMNELSIAPMSELPKFKMIQIATIHEDNELTGDNKTWAYDGKYKLLKTMHDGLFDLEIKYTGTNRQETKNGLKIVPMNETHIYQYNGKKQNYIRIQ